MFHWQPKINIQWPNGHQEKKLTWRVGLGPCPQENSEILHLQRCNRPFAAKPSRDLFVIAHNIKIFEETFGVQNQYHLIAYRRPCIVNFRNHILMPLINR